MTDIKFSVVIPTFNRSGLVIDAIESALKQSYTNVEIIVVDDGSTDDTQQALAKYSTSIKLITIKNSGVSFARNTGILHASGSHIAYLDSDDIWQIDYLEKMASVINKYEDANIIISDFRRYFMKQSQYSHLTNTDSFPFIKTIFKPKDDNIYYGSKIETTAALLEGYPIFPSSLIINKKIHDHLRWDPNVFKSEDFNLALKLSKFSGMYYVDMAMTTIRMHDSNKSYDSVTKARVHLSSMIMLRDLYSKNQQEKALVNFYLARKYSSAAMHDIKNLNFTSGAYFLFKSFTSKENYKRIFKKLLTGKASTYLDYTDQL